MSHGMGRTRAGMCVGMPRAVPVASDCLRRPTYAREQRHATERAAPQSCHKHATQHQHTTSSLLHVHVSVPHAMARTHTSTTPTAAPRPDHPPLTHSTPEQASTG